MTCSLDSGARVEACLHGFPSESVSEGLSSTDAKDAVKMMVGTRKKVLGTHKKREEVHGVGECSRCRVKGSPDPCDPWPIGRGSASGVHISGS